MLGCLALLSSLVSLRLLSLNSTLGAALSRSSYDVTCRLAAPWQPPLTNSPVLIVYLDLDSYLTELQSPTRPWDRALHARLLHRLHALGAKVVGFDILFSEASSDDDADRAFAEAIRAHGGVVLGAEIHRSDHDPGTLNRLSAVSLALPYAPLLQAGADWGIAQLSIDEDFVARRLFSGYVNRNQPSLSLAMARRGGASVATESYPNQRRYVRYYGKPFTIPHLGYSHALATATNTSELFRDRFVLIGGRPISGLHGQRQDEFRSPLSDWEDEDLFYPGVEVHATQLLNLLREDWLWRPTLAAEILGTLMLAWVTVGGLFRLRPLTAVLAAALTEAALASAAVLAAVQYGMWCPWLIGAAFQVPFALGGSVVFQSVEWYRERRRLETARRLAAEQIKRQAALIDKAQDAILVTDLDGRPTYANPRAIRLYGWSLADLQLMGLDQTVFAESATALAVLARESARVRGEWTGDMLQRTKAGLRLDTESRWTLIRGEQGQPESLLIVSTDVTEKKSLEARFLRSQRMDTIGALAGGMAHDLNNALAPVLMGIQLLRHKTRDEELARTLSVMESNTHRGADLVKQVLLFSRGRDGQRERLDPASVLRETVQTLQQTFPRSIRVTAMIPQDLWPVHADPTQLYQVLLNLCVNARDAMREGGELTLAADNVEMSAAEAGEYPGARAGRFVLLLVADTGSGIPEELRPRLFEPFFTTKPAGEGTGLGLSTVRRIVESHGGFIHLRSELGVGTTFEVYLPELPVHSPSETPVDPALGAAPVSEGALLFADDDRSVTELIRSCLSDAGCEILTAADGGEALQILRSRHHEVSLVFLDVDMPILGGLDVLCTVRTAWPGLPVVLMSGQMLDRRRLGPDTDMPPVLAKPFRLEELIAMIRQHRRLLPTIVVRQAK